MKCDDFRHPRYPLSIFQRSPLKSEALKKTVISDVNHTIQLIEMRKGRFTGGIILLVVGFIGLVISWSDYSSLTAVANSSLGQLAQGFNSTLATQVATQEGEYMIGIIISGIIAIIGIALMVVGARGEPKQRI